MEDLVLIDSDGIIFADTESHTIQKVETPKPEAKGSEVISFEVSKEIIVNLPIDLPENRGKV
jgi:hypothetical protein